MKKTAVVSTTIRKPLMLEGACKNAKFYNRKNIEFFVVGDKKTPTDTPDYCKELSSKYSYPIHYMELEEQDKMLENHKELLGLFPYNDSNRKLLGMIRAYMDGFENLITLDDDNYVTNHDFFGGHDIVGTEKDLSLVESSSGWFNVCEYLIEENNMPIYHRGFPWSKRMYGKNELVTIQRAKRKIVVNGGFWLGDPDVDAVSRLFHPIRAVGMDESMAPNFGLFPGTWCPFNNQNTAMSYEILPGYLTIHHHLRFADLFPAYVICKIAGHLNHVIAYGYPLVIQPRNPHNLWIDLEHEIDGTQAIEPFIELLRSAELTGKNYHDCLGELNEHFSSKRNTVTKYPKKQKDMLLAYFDSLAIYHEAFKTIKRN